jgi:alpha-1,4-digalacturonate transport system substrate-binding protein
MNKIIRTVLLGTAVGALGAGAGFAQDAVQLTYLFSDDNPTAVERMKELTEQFNSEHPDIEVEFISTAYDAVMRQLPMQLAVGEGPDIAKVADRTLSRFGLDMRPYMQDPDGFAALYGDTMKTLREGDEPGSDSIKGFNYTQTLNMPFVNVTLFEQAGVPLPVAGATLDEIAQASVKVAEATGVAIPFTIDRSGHRLTGPILSAGSQIIDADGTFTFPDDAAKGVIEELYSLTESGAFPKEMWGAAGGTAYKSMGEEFMNANAVTYLSGNWMVGAFAEGIGDAFDWTVIPAPCGPAGCVAMPGGTAIMAFEHTEHPEQVAQFIEWLGSAENQKTLAEEFIQIPGANVTDLNYQTDNENVKNAMKVFLDNRSTVTDQALQLNNATGNTAFFNTIVQRVSQLIVGELSLDQLYETLEKDMADINTEVAAAKK